MANAEHIACLRAGRDEWNRWRKAHSRADLSGATLRGVDVRGTSLRRAKLHGADLTGAILRHASLAETDLEGATLDGAEVYGAGIWGLKGKPASQIGLIIAADDESPAITVDDLDTAQLLFVLMDNPRIANVIDTASSRTGRPRGCANRAAVHPLSAVADALVSGCRRDRLPRAPVGDVGVA